jgi:beta-glucanase (GH16 family)
MFIRIIFFLLISHFILFGCQDKSTEPINEDSTKGWQLVWADEFNYIGLPDSNKWGYDVGGHGWGNQELQFYTSHRTKNARVENGILIIEAFKEKWEANDYTSARLVSRGKGDWTYGRFEIKAILPHGRGTWPAIWMLPTQWAYGNGGWPDNGEIDIMEHVGYDPGWVHGSIHTKAYYWQINTQKTAKIYVPDAEVAFHVYAMEWTPEKIEIFIDSTKYFSFSNEHKGWEVWPFDKDFHLLLNIAVGGGWGGQKGVDDSIFPQKMEVDYVRVFKWVE